MRIFFAGAAVVVALSTLSGCPLLMKLNAEVRVVHASPDAPNVDVCVNGAPGFENVPFGTSSNYASLRPCTTDIKVTAAGTGCDSSGVIEAELDLAAKTDYTVVALGRLANIEPLVLIDDNEAPAAGNAKIRFVHASADAPTVDITLADGTTLFDNVAFKQVGDYLEVAAGDYPLEVRDETGTVTVLQLGEVSLESGAVYTAFAIGLLNPGVGEPALSALLTLDN